MASLGEFFKAKKKIKPTNLNNKDSAAINPQEKKTQSQVDEEWAEEQTVAVATIKGVEVAGNIEREEDAKDSNDSTAPAWGALKTNKSTVHDERRFPSLQKSNVSTSIHIGNNEAKINIATSKNIFSALEGVADSDDEEEQQRPKEIKPAMVSKKKGERQNEAVSREIEKYSVKGSKQEAVNVCNDDDREKPLESGAEEAPTAGIPAVVEKTRKSKQNGKEEKVKAEKPVEEDDLRIVVDCIASKEKYQGKKKLPLKVIPQEDLEEEKENRPNTKAHSGKKKKIVNEDIEDKKMQYADW